MAVAAGLSMLAMVAGLLSSYLVPKVPPSFGILAVASLTYGLTFLHRRGTDPSSAGADRDHGGSPVPHPGISVPVRRNVAT